MAGDARLTAAAEIVAVQGIRGCFSQQAAAVLAPHAEVLFCETMADAFAAVQQRSAGSLAVPVRNTIAGEIYPHLDLIAAHPHFARRAVTHLPIAMCLLAVSGATLEGIREVLSHPVALRQCSEFFALHPHIKPVEYSDTAAAACHIGKSNDPATAALASAEAARVYGLAILQSHVQDITRNETEFWLMSPDTPSS